VEVVAEMALARSKRLGAAVLVGYFKDISVPQLQVLLLT
jgi:hypothetical protein